MVLVASQRPATVPYQVWLVILWQVGLEAAAHSLMAAAGVYEVTFVGSHVHLCAEGVCMSGVSACLGVSPASDMLLAFSAA